MTPFLFAVLGILLVWATSPPVQRWLKRSISADWPMVPGTFENGAVTRVRRSKHTVFELTAVFSYKVNDENYNGEYTEDFGVEPEAQQILRSLRNGPLYVRYNPKKPSGNALDPYRDVRPPESI